MKKYLFLCFVFSVFAASAQIQFTKNDFGANGDKVIYAVDSPALQGYNFGATGPNHSWQFNTNYRYPRRYDSTTFITATSNPNAPNVTTNLLARSIGTGDQYLEVTDSFIKTTFDFPQFNVTGVKLKTLNLPLTYQSQFTDSTTATAKGLFADFGIDPLPPFDSIRIQAKIKLVSVCDGWGTLILPDTTSYNTLKVNQQIMIEADIYFHSIIGWTYVTHRSQQNGNYSWYAPNSKNFLANVQLDTSGNFASFTHKIKKSPPGPRQDKIVSLSPDSIIAGDTIEVLVKGTKTLFTAKMPVVTIPNCQILNTQVINDTTLFVRLTCPYTTKQGTYYFQVLTAAGYSYADGGFTILKSPRSPRLVAIGPNFGAVGQTITTTITGTNTHFTKGLHINLYTDSVSPGSIFVQSFTVINDTVLTCDILIESTAAYVPFTLYVNPFPDGNLYLEGGFIVTHTGLNEEASESVHIYPNPATDVLTISLPPSQQSSLLQLFDLNGREVKRVITTDTKTTLQLDGLKNALYILKVTGEQVTFTRKITIQP